MRPTSSNRPYTLAYVEWNSDGKVCRIVRMQPGGRGIGVSVPDRMANALRDGWVPDHYFDEYDVNWCERDETYYVWCVGGHHGRIYLNELIAGFRSKIWAAPDIEFRPATLDNGELTPAAVLELGYDLVELDEPPEDLSQTCEEVSCYWCERCHDMLPDNDTCRHYTWSDEQGVLVDEHGNEP